MIPTPVSEEANDDDPETSDRVTTEPHRSTRVRSAPEWYGNPILEVMLLDHDKPTNYEEAMMSPNSGKWLDLPDDRQATKNKWIFKKKTDADGNVTVYKVQKVFVQFKELTMMRPSHP